MYSEVTVTSWVMTKGFAVDAEVTVLESEEMNVVSTAGPYR